MNSQTIIIEAGKIKPNPFKKYIDKGQLSEIIIEELIEGFKQTTFHDNLAGRTNKKGEIELIYGHHRLEAVKRCYGNDYKISLKVYSLKEFSDEKMLIDMIRENLTQRSNDFKEMLHSILLVKRWLEGTLFNPKAKPKKVEYTQIARFISKSGKALSSPQVARYLNIDERLDHELKDKVEVANRAGQINEGNIGIDLAYNLSKTKKEDQPFLLAQIEKVGANRNKARSLISEFRRSDDTIKEKVKKGEVGLDEMSIENMKQEIKKNKEAKTEKEKSQIKVIPYKKYLDEASGMVGTANTEIYKACALLHGLDQSGVLYELDWETVRNILELARKRSEEYSKFVDKIIEKIGG